MKKHAFYQACLLILIACSPDVKSVEYYENNIDKESKVGGY